MIPRATYRIQFRKDFGFDDVAAIAPYLAQLGISHVYASPYLQARPGSKHGYDITNHNSLNPELGGLPAYRRMLQAFRENGLQHILDYVPNHMGVGGADNPFWLDVLEWGRGSLYANWFDIDWESHSEYLSGKLLVPFLANQYGYELESGRFELKFDPADGSFSIWLYGTHKLPVTPSCYSKILADSPELKELAQQFAALADSLPNVRDRAHHLQAQLAQSVASNQPVRAAIDSALARFRGQPGKLHTWDHLDSLIRVQHWRPSHFRVASDDINYRRFFNINDLAGICMEMPEVFEYAHRLVFSLLLDGSLQGLRIDHIDGLYNPKEYLQRLRSSVPQPFYLVVEKILGRYEHLRQDWPIAGTTGYEFSAQVTALLVDPTAEARLTAFYEEFTGETQTFPEIVRESKIKIMENELRSELEALSHAAVLVARQDPYTTDFTRRILRRALREIIACFPVYRTYVDGNGRDEDDERYIHWAVAQASKNEQEVDPSVFEFLEKLLNGEIARHNSGGFHQRSALRCAMKAQQLSGPVMAKGLEDTALYRYNRFIALNEVGCSPEQFGLSVASFHKENQLRAENWPATLLATSTHDTKHGEDARARLAALSLIPEEWTAKAASWSRVLRARRGDVEGAAPPARNDEYLLLQNLVATWPAELTLPNALDPSVLAQYTERLQQGMIKSIREARVHSNWIAPNTSYENGVTEFIGDALNPQVAQTFLDIFLPFQQRIAEIGVRNSLVQVFLKITSPGVPDIYQGTELWDLSLPDPDNRRPVDFAARRRLFSNLPSATAKSCCCSFPELLKNWHNGAIKLAVTQKLLIFRRENCAWFSQSSYEPVQTPDLPWQFCAFFRKAEQQSCLAVASLDARINRSDYPGAGLPLPSQIATQWREVITNKTIQLENGAIPLSQILDVLPVALLVPASNHTNS
jgi:(1->4)-alpha-D-glucan 1-alpha-D-glucosylmutase